MTRLADLWPPYEPSEAAPWNLRRVVHLHRRAGFAGTWSELARDLADGHQAAIDRFLRGGAYSAGAARDFDIVSSPLADAAVSSSNPQRLKAWWLYRMIFSPDPLAERLALVWHNHFATSNAKVDNVEMMREQNDTFRALSQGSFAELLLRVVKGPALLVWLDADKNRAGHANENLGRELLELFTLGIGNYSESDVQQAARALTGWKVVGSRFRFDEAGHDDGEKTILGQTGKFTGDDLLKIVVVRRPTAARLAWRICQALLGERGADPAALAALAAGLRERNLDIGWGIETVLRSERFFCRRWFRCAHRRAARVRGGCGPLTGVLCPAPQHAAVGRIVDPHGAGPFLSAECRRLARGAGMAEFGRGRGAGQLCVGLGRRHGSPTMAQPPTWRRSSSATPARRIWPAACGGWVNFCLAACHPETIEIIAGEAMRTAEPRRSPLATAAMLLLTRPEAFLG